MSSKNELAEKIACRLRDEKPEEEIKPLKKQLRRLYQREEYKLVGLLNAFYQHQRSFEYDTHLIIWRFSNGAPRLQSHGAEYQEFRTRKERNAKLIIYQNEMSMFASFLKDKFLAKEGDNIPPT